MKRILLFCCFFKTIICSSQIGLNVEFASAPNDITYVTIKDSSDYVEGIEDLHPSCFFLIFKRDSLVSVEFKYPIFGLVTVPKEEKIIKSDISLIKNKDQISLYLKYYDSYYGKKFYVLSGSLTSVPNQKTQRFVPFGTNIVQSKLCLSVFYISKNSYKRTDFMDFKDNISNW